MVDEVLCPDYFRLKIAHFRAYCGSKLQVCIGQAAGRWKIFIGSLLFSNAYWTLVCYMGITLVEWGWKAIVS